MCSDMDRWEEKYRQAEPDSVGDADATLRSLARWFDGAGQALDLACGAGANLQWLHRQGYRVTGMDRSLEALKLACRQPDGRQFRLIAADLETTELPHQCYAAIIVVHYLDRTLFPAIVRALKPGGRLFYKTFNKNLLQQRPGFNPDFVLEIGELQRSFGELKPRVIAEPDTGNPVNSWVVMEQPETPAAGKDHA
ncbi:MAG: class I SAM-dependent methyltransferase [Gammaproteobacteria bacterium]|nr:MAG: class I SAM-dependent methyltransferase [Gammaproteobacteria bacterium]